LLAAIVSTKVGYVALGLLVGGESAGIPLPGETALITAAILASRGHLSLPLVIATAAGTAIVGDNIGYLIGRRGGRWLMTRPGRWHAHRLALVERGERFFLRHGGKTVFFGRWLPVLRITAAWLAGVHRMRWQTFALWNALGGIGWAITVGVAAYLAGEAAKALLRDAGLVGLGLVLLGAVIFVWFRLGRPKPRFLSGFRLPSPRGRARRGG
jgi:membrane protein DedA with SNARE-associated domain